MQKPSFFTMILLISFASVNAVLFTPALPQMTGFFGITEAAAQQTITWFLIGYTLGQLLYGPIANRFGRKPALYVGISLQIASSVLCALVSKNHYDLLVLGRFLLALGSGVGLKMTFTLINECYEPKVASQKISQLMLAFAITPGLSVALGGFLAPLGWQSCFIAGGIYGLLLLFLVRGLPETQTVLDLNALKLNHLLDGYGKQFKNKQLSMGGFLMGCSTAFIYAFPAIAPFVALNVDKPLMSHAVYGVANLLPSIGLIIGSVWGSHLAKKHSHAFLIKLGIGAASAGTVLMFVAMMLHAPIVIALFSPMVLIYFGLCILYANASTVAMSHVHDKAHGSAVMSFLNMGTATLVVLCIGLFPMGVLLLPLIYVGLSVAMVVLFKNLSRH